MRLPEQNELPSIATLVPDNMHVGCIMDGNGRWAQMRHLSRSDGHREAEHAVVATIDGCLTLGIRHLTLFTFAIANWNRSDEEVGFLMKFDQWLLHRDRVDAWIDAGVKILIVGRPVDERVPPNKRVLFSQASRRYLQSIQERSADNSKLTLRLAFNYGGEEELRDAAEVYHHRALSGEVLRFEDCLYDPEMPPIDLVIRTSGEERLSGFFPYHSAQAELIFIDTLWPDFRLGHLAAAVLAFSQRKRRFGGSSQT
jgi:undecaprenyl diphosphate synthase